MKKPANDEQTIKAMIAWLEGYPKFRGVMVLFDESDGTITDLGNTDIATVVAFSNAYKAFVDNIVGSQIMTELIPAEDIATHVENHICECRMDELEQIGKYITTPGNTVGGLIEMVNHRIAKAKGEA